MKDIAQIVILSVCTVILTGVLRKLKPEYSAALSVACGVCVLLISLPKIISLIELIKNVLPSESGLYESFRIFFKCIIICQICTLAKSYCRDFSNSFIASCIDLSEKAAIIILAIPLIESVIKTVNQFIGD